MDTVLAPFLDTYHRNIQNSYQQLTGKILRRIKDEINAAIQKKQQIYTELTQLADDLKVPGGCFNQTAFLLGRKQYSWLNFLNGKSSNNSLRYGLRGKEFYTSTD